MAFETKVIMSLLAQSISKADTVEEAYNVVRAAAGVEGLKLPSYEDMKKGKPDVNHEDN